MKAFDKSRLKYEWRYWWGQTPWETEVTPPEVLAFIQNTRNGKALDLGCGTGTHAITLAQHGWRVTGIDFSRKAIHRARCKAAKAGAEIAFHIADVTSPLKHNDLYDFVLDIGCFFSLREKDRKQYIEMLAGLVRPKGCYMLFSWLPRLKRGRIVGILPEEAKLLFQENFKSIRTRIGVEKGCPCAWCWFERRCAE